MAMDQVGSGIAASLRGVDCAANAMTEAAFGRLFGSGGALMPALTILLTLYVAFFAFSLITGRSRIGVSALTPRMMTLGFVLTFATSWVAYQSVVWNLATGAPDQIAGILMGTAGSATDTFARKIDIVFGALVEASGGQNMEGPASAFSPQGLLWMGGTLLLLGTVGVLVTARIALAVLLALGPVFVVLALFQGTRGLFVGWLKAVVLLALTPLFAVLSGSLMLELAVPVLSALSETPGQINPQPAMGFFLIGCVHAALMVLVMKVAGTMVSGWSVFGLAPAQGAAGSSARQAGRNSTPVPAASMAMRQPASSAAARDIRVAATLPSAANDSGSGRAGQRETRIVTVPAAIAGGSASSTSSTVSRARGIGSRFRATRSTETGK
ncbi:type VI secretion protein [Altererythrobacter endophyticus]|uniref:Type VI secretion protein n=2 Tax=Altericroceibacterium endophyticum TaxID=1808508 RepID=A0A6I4T804_9SPHN|nr:type IV secretion system protein [Altericroceibacterium endophyticum]MXO66808.1 type VI secretion protein [Altericroceibacterium endophyticum]